MNFDLSYDSERDVIVGHVTGRVDAALVAEMSAQLAALMKRTGCHRLLNDLRDADLTPSTFDIYSLPRIVDQKGVSRVCRRALVISKGLRDFDFLETVSANLGQQVRIFTDLEDATAWLLSEGTRASGKPGPDLPSMPET